MLIYQVFIKIVDLKFIKMLIAKIVELQSFCVNCIMQKNMFKKITR
jgi:hypothetical protein